MLCNGYLRGEFERIGPALILHFGVERGEKGLGEFCEICVGSLDRALPENEIRDEG